MTIEKLMKDHIDVSWAVGDAVYGAVDDAVYEADPHPNLEKFLKGAGSG